MAISSFSPGPARGRPADHDSWIVITPVLALLALQVALYVWMARRGFDLTDESYYFLNYLYWRDDVGPMSLFGAYFELPFRLLGQSIAAMRVFSLVLLLAGSAFFLREVLQFAARYRDSPQRTRWGYMAAGMAGSLFYFGPLNTLRSPSYNLLALVAMMVATGLLFRLADRSASSAATRRVAFFYGIAMGACILGKVTSAALLLLLHMVFFVWINRDWRPRRLFSLGAIALGGVCVNLIPLQVADPHWFESLRIGLMLRMEDGSHNLWSTTNALWSDIRDILPHFLVRALALGSVVAVLAVAAARTYRWLQAALVLVVVGVCVVYLIQGLMQWWLFYLMLAALLVWLIEFLCAPVLVPSNSESSDGVLVLLLLLLPFALSFGTNMSILTHSQQAAVFPITVLLLRIRRLEGLGMIGTPTVVACLSMLCVPALAVQVRAVTNVRYTYRQLTAMNQQSVPVILGAAGTTLDVDRAEYHSLQAVLFAARASGLAPRQPVLDLTGDGPGLVFALGDRPLGLTWLLGGYPGSQRIAADVIAMLSTSQLRDAWLITSDNNPRAIKDWQRLLDARIGSGAHELVSAAYMQAEYHWLDGAPDRVSVELWRPSAAAGVTSRNN